MLDTRNARDRIAYYSVLRYVADPLRDEAVNVGLFLVSEGADWARFAAHIPRDRLRSLGRRADAEQVEEWTNSLRLRFDVEGPRSLLGPEGRLSVNALREWSDEFGGSLRISEPRVAIDPDLEVLWRDLYGTLVKASKRRALGVEGASQRVLVARERRDVVNAFVATVRAWPTFDQSYLKLDARFDGSRAPHFADLAIVNGRVKAIAQVLPLVHGTEREVVTSRALLVEAAVDLAPEVVKLGLYDDPPDERRDLLEATSAVILEIAERNVVLVPTRQFYDLDHRFALTLFPGGTDYTGRVG